MKALGFLIGILLTISASAAYFGSPQAQFILQDSSAKEGTLIWIRNDSVALEVLDEDLSPVHLVLPASFFKEIKLETGEVLDSSTVIFPLPPFPVEAVAYLRSGRSQTVNFWAVFRDSVYFRGELPNGNIKQISVHKDAIEWVEFPNGDILNLDLERFYFTSSDQNMFTDSAIEAYLSTFHWLDTLKITPDRPPFGHLTIYTTESGFPIYFNNQKLEGKTPIKVDSVPPGTHLIETRWDVGVNVWADQEQVRVRKGDTLKIHLKPGKVQPTLAIRSFPSNAEIFWGTKSNPYYPSDKHTPFILRQGRLGIQTFTLRHFGYRDTTISVQMAIDSLTLADIRLTPIRNRDLLQNQRLEYKKRQNKLTSRILSWTSVAPAAAAAIMMFMAENDLDHAASLKNQLTTPTFQSGTNFRQTVRDNQTFHDRGMRKRWAALGFGLLSVTLFSISIGFSE